MASERKLTVVIAGDAKGFSKAIDDTDDKVGKLDGRMGALAKTAGIGLAGAAVGAGVALFGMAQAAAEDEQAQKRLATTLQNTTRATDSQIAGVEKFISGITRATGVMDDDLRPAFDVLVRGTKDLGTAQTALSLALDISAGTGKPLVEVSDALAKAYEGNTKSLRGLTPEMSSLIREGASLDEIMKALSGTFEGQAATAADTTAGKMQILKARFAEFQEEIGTKVLPVIDALVVFADETLLPALDGIRDAFGENGVGGALKEMVRLWNESQPEIQAALGDMMSKLAEIVKENSDEFVAAGVQIGADIVEGIRRGMIQAGIEQIPGAEKAFKFINRPGQGSALKDAVAAQRDADARRSAYAGRTKHTGGIFRAPTPGGEGMAWLRDGEKVSTPGASVGGGQTIILQLNGREVARALTEDQRSGGEPVYVKLAAR